MSVKISAIPMPNGDFFVVEYEGVSGEKHAIVLDMGTRHAYMRTGRCLLRQFESIDLCVLSHIHDDHIGGALKYIDDIHRGLKIPFIKQWWFNASRVDALSIVYEAAEPTSVQQANGIAKYLSSECKAEAWNNMIKRGDIFCVDGIVIHVLSPADVYPFNQVPCPEEQHSVVPARIPQSDYGTRVADFELDSFTEDNSVDNRYSIALLLDYQGKRFLWMADASPSVVCEALRNLGYDEANPLECEYMTLSHHGSKKNTSSELLSLIDCKNFIITGNGINYYRLPNKETLARVIRYQGEDVRFHTTSLTPQLKRIFDVDGKFMIEEKTEFNINI